MNEILLFIIALFSTLFVVLMWKLGKQRLYSAIIIFLILVTTVGGKIVPFFGHNTNTGNVFYASVFLATYFLIERYGKREGIKSIWVGVVGVIAFSCLVYLSVLLVGSPETTAIDESFRIAFSPILRITFASLLAYILSQNINVYLYVYLKEKFEGRKLWLRANICNLVAQILDSVVFFTFAFFGSIPFSTVIGALVTGIVIKIVFIIITSPLLYLNRIQEDGEEDYSSITIS
jgi:queuosine precursor transporter